jgi:hypothetical protein
MRSGSNGWSRREPPVAGRRDDEAASALLKEALDLWRGEAVADIRQASFAQSVARRLADQRLLALESRIQALIAALPVICPSFGVSSGLRPRCGTGWFAQRRGAGGCRWPEPGRRPACAPGVGTASADLADAAAIVTAARYGSDEPGERCAYAPRSPVRCRSQWARLMCLSASTCQRESRPGHRMDLGRAGGV